MFSWAKQGGLNPINASHAEGSYVYDRDGKKYLDFSSQLMNVNIGHGDQRITEAVVKQMKEVSYVYPGMATDVRGKLGKKIAEITPGNLSKSFFTLDCISFFNASFSYSTFKNFRHFKALSSILILESKFCLSFNVIFIFEQTKFIKKAELCIFLIAKDASEGMLGFSLIIFRAISFMASIVAENLLFDFF